MPHSGEINQELLDLLERGDSEALAQFLYDLSWSDRARAISDLGPDNQTRLFTLLSPADAAELVDSLTEEQAAELIENLSPSLAADIVEELPSDEGADLLGDMPRQEAHAILREMAPEQARDIRQLYRYEDNEAGGLMTHEFIAFEEGSTIEEVRQQLFARASEIADYNIQYIYITAKDGKPSGVLSIRDLITRPASAKVDNFMRKGIIIISHRASLDLLTDLFADHPFLGLPVVDDHGKLIGVVSRDAVQQAETEKAENDFRSSQGIIGGEEIRSLPLTLRARRRLGWLSINIVLNLLAVSVIEYYRDTLSAVIALAVFLPIISDMSGCSGNQAVAVSIRELTLGLVRPVELFRVLVKEASVGIINGMALGLLLGVVTFLWNGNPWLGLVVGGALAANTVVSVSIGGLLPLAVKGMGFDPALSSGLILTTITDMCGFFLALSFASALLPYLK